MRALPEGVVLKHGAHRSSKSPEDGMCAMEIVAWLAGEENTDTPACTCPVIASVVRSWNDGMGTADDETRTRILAPLLPKLLDTRAPSGEAGDVVLLKRMYMVVDWQIRVYAPAFLRAAGLVEAADSLASLPEVIDNERLIGTVKAESAATSAARSAATSAAESAAWSAAWSAARSAARSALAPTVATLQESAAALVLRLCEVT